MEFQKVVNFLNTIPDDKDLPRFVTKKWIDVYDQSEKNYNPNKKVRIKMSMLRSDLCDFSDAYIVVEGDITLGGDNDPNKGNKNLAFKNNALFIICISKIYLNTVKTIEKRQAVFGIIIEMNQGILFLLILNILNTKQIL